MIEEIVLTEEFSLEGIEERDGRFFFTAKALNKNFECERGRERLANDSKFKHFIWRHQHPVQEGNEETHIYGRIDDAWLEGKDKEIFAKYEIYGHTPEHLALREDIKERQTTGDPLGVSMRYRKYYVGDTVLHYDVLEHSGTPFPACEDCKGTNFEVVTMVNETENKTEIELEEEDVELAKSVKKIEELEALLNSKTKILEGIQTEMVALEKELKKKDKELEEATKSEESLEQTVDNLKLEVERLKKKPIVDSILEYIPKIAKDEKYLSWLKDQDEDYLKEKLEEAKHEAETKPIVKAQEESAEEARGKADEELEKKEPSMEHFTKHVQKYQSKENNKNNSNK
jgi:hypothetical protein